MQTSALTFYRFIAAAMVVIFHFGQDTFISSLAPGFFNSGPEMVTFFFVLSGFIMAMTSIDQPQFTAARYWLNRFSKIYPAYLIAAVIMMLFFGNKDSAHDSTAILLHLTMLQSWVPNYPLTVNVPAWSLSIEAFFYALFPAILFFIKNKKPTAKQFFIFAITLWLVTQIIHVYLLNSARFYAQQDLIHFFVWYFPLSHLCSFVLGIAGYFLLTSKGSDSIENQSSLTPLIALIASLASIFLVLAFKADVSSAWGIQLPFESSLLSPLFLLLILVTVYCDNAFTRFISLPFFIRLGEASYAVYILQKPIRSLYQMYIYPTINTTLHIHLTSTIHFVAYFLLLVCISMWVTTRIEKPVKLLLRKTLS